MPPKNNLEEDCPKRLKITLALKHEIIENRERGMSVAALANTYNRSSSTICTILKNKDKIKETVASKGVTRISMQRLQVLNDVERLLLEWINEQQSRGDTLSENIICEKAKMIFADLLEKMPVASKPEKVFKASHGWFEKFKRRIGMHSGVHKRNIDELMERDNQELTTEDLMELHYTSQKEVSEESFVSEVEDQQTEQQSSGCIREMLNAWEIVASFIEKHHPDKTAALYAINIFNDSAVLPFRQILKRR